MFTFTTLASGSLGNAALASCGDTHILLDAGISAKRITAGLAALGCRVCPGEANYLLFFHGAPGLSHRLAERGVLIRNCSNYCGLGPGWYRAAVRGREENAAFLAAMKEVL